MNQEVTAVLDGQRRQSLLDVQLDNGFDVDEEE